MVSICPGKIQYRLLEEDAYKEALTLVNPMEKVTSKETTTPAMGSQGTSITVHFIKTTHINNFIFKTYTRPLLSKYTD